MQISGCYIKAFRLWHCRLQYAVAYAVGRCTTIFFSNFFGDFLATAICEAAIDFAELRSGAEAWSGMECSAFFGVVCFAPEPNF